MHSTAEWKIYFCFHCTHPQMFLCAGSTRSYFYRQDSRMCLFFYIRKTTNSIFSFINLFYFTGMHRWAAILLNDLFLVNLVNLVCAGAFSIQFGSSRKAAVGYWLFRADAVACCTTSRGFVNILEKSRFRSIWGISFKPCTQDAYTFSLTVTKFLRRLRPQRLETGLHSGFPSVLPL